MSLSISLCLHFRAERTGPVLCLHFTEETTGPSFLPQSGSRQAQCTSSYLCRCLYRCAYTSGQAQCAGCLCATTWSHRLPVATSGEKVPFSSEEAKGQKDRISDTWTREWFRSSVPFLRFVPFRFKWRPREWRQPLDPVSVCAKSKAPGYNRIKSDESNG